MLLGGFEIASVLQNSGKVVKRRGHSGVFGAQMFAAQSQGPLIFELALLRDLPCL